MTNKNTQHKFNPQAGPQEKLFYSFSDEVLFGGDRGCGKTTSLLFLCQTHVREYKDDANCIVFLPNYHCVNDILNLAEEMFFDCHFDKKNGVVNFYNGGTVKFRGLDTERDLQKYKDAKFTMVAFDGADHLETPADINIMRKTLNNHSPSILKRLFLTATAGGRGDSWIKEEFIDPTHPNTSFYPNTSCYKKTKSYDETKKSRIFIPARFFDNKIMLKKDPNYIRRLLNAAGGNIKILNNWLGGEWTDTQTDLN